MSICHLHHVSYECPGEKSAPTEALEQLRQRIHVSAQILMSRVSFGDQVESSVTIGPDGARIVMIALIPKEAWKDV